jgi:hypothetical protein
MALREDLIREIENNLRASLVPSYTQKAKASDAFEAFVFSIIVRAAIEEGARTPIEWEDTSGRPASNRVMFRRSPGYINYRGVPYTHAIIDFPDAEPLEVHLGIYAIGVANIPQECDIAVVKRSEAEKCRRIANGNAPVSSTNVLIGVECKCYESSRISLGLGRSFLGLIKDFSSKGKYFFVFNNSYKSVEKLLSHHNQEWEHNLTPTSMKEIDRLRYSFQSRFKRYKSLF